MRVAADEWVGEKRRRFTVARHLPSRRFVRLAVALVCQDDESCVDAPRDGLAV
jgi:hypothetical protein